MIFVAETADGEKVEYKDKKRYLWILSILSPSIPGNCSCYPALRWEHDLGSFPADLLLRVCSNFGCIFR